MESGFPRPSLKTFVHHVGGRLPVVPAVVALPVLPLVCIMLCLSPVVVLSAAGEHQQSSSLPSSNLPVPSCGELHSCRRCAGAAHCGWEVVNGRGSCVDGNRNGPTQGSGSQYCPSVRVAVPVVTTSAPLQLSSSLSSSGAFTLPADTALSGGRSEVGGVPTASPLEYVPFSSTSTGDGASSNPFPVDPPTTGSLSPFRPETAVPEITPGPFTFPPPLSGSSSYVISSAGFEQYSGASGLPWPPGSLSENSNPYPPDPAYPRSGQGSSGNSGGLPLPVGDSGRMGPWGSYPGQGSSNSGGASFPPTTESLSPFRPETAVPEITPGPFTFPPPLSGSSSYVISSAGFEQYSGASGLPLPEPRRRHHQQQATENKKDSKRKATDDKQYSFSYSRRRRAPDEPQQERQDLLSNTSCQWVWGDLLVCDTLSPSSQTLNDLLDRNTSLNNLLGPSPDDDDDGDQRTMKLGLWFFLAGLVTLSIAASAATWCLVRRNRQRQQRRREEYEVIVQATRNFPHRSTRSGGGLIPAVPLPADLGQTQPSGVDFSDVELEIESCELRAVGGGGGKHFTRERPEVEESREDDEEEVKSLV